MARNHLVSYLGVDRCLFLHSSDGCIPTLGIRGAAALFLAPREPVSGLTSIFSRIGSFYLRLPTWELCSLRDPAWASSSIPPGRWWGTARTTLSKASFTTAAK